MSRCYLSNVELTEENNSVEHVIPNSLHGKLKSNRLLCKEVNNGLGDEIDAALAKQITIGNILAVKRDRGRSPQVSGVTEEGKKFHIESHNTGKQAASKPITTKLENGLEAIEFLEGQAKDIVKSIKKKYPHLSAEELEKSITYKPANTEKQVVFFENHLSVISGIDSYRAIAKIATNFYALNCEDHSHIAQINEFVLGNDKSAGHVKYFYPNENPVGVEEDEISHILYIKGDSNERILYCYIELYNLHNFIVVLNKEYDGPDISYSYIYDLDNREQIDREIDVSLESKTVNELPCPGPENLETLYFDKLDRLAKNKDLDIRTKKI